MAKFTQAPWIASKLRCTGELPGVDIGSVDNSNIALVWFDVAVDKPNEVRSRAHLIAASRELYEACKAARLYLAEDIKSIVWKKLNDALAKADGKAE